MVCIFDETDGEYMFRAAGAVRQDDVALSVEKRIEPFAAERGSGEVVFAMEPAVKVVDNGRAWDSVGEGEVLFVGVVVVEAAPRDKVVVACGEVDGEGVVGLSEMLSAVDELFDERAVVVVGAESDGFHLIGEGVSPFEVHIVMEGDFVGHRAVALEVVEGVAGDVAQGDDGDGEPFGDISYALHDKSGRLNIKKVENHKKNIAGRAVEGRPRIVRSKIYYHSRSTPLSTTRHERILISAARLVTSSSGISGIIISSSFGTGVPRPPML